MQQRSARLIVLRVQVAKNANGNRLQLAKLCDIAELLRTQGSLKFGQVLTEAKGIGGTRIVLFALCLTNNLLGAPLAKEVASELRSESSIHQLVEHACRQFRRGG